jgi:WhiB family transcriptional regulator, redox-sensing transcriptional regulator
VTAQNPDWQQEAAALAELAGVPDAELERQVAAHGRCLWEITFGDPPEFTGEPNPDRELAARLCAGCPVRRECLEFELRTAGEETVGVWGGLSEDDRRALHAVWRARATPADDVGPGRDACTPGEEKGGERERDHAEFG